MSATLRAALLLGLLLFGASAVLDGALAAERGQNRQVVRKSKAVVQKTRVAAPASKQASKQARARPARALAASETIQDARQLALQSSAALVVEQDGGEPIFQKNAEQVAPIASITKLMTAMVVLDSAPNLQETITITDEDIDYLRGSRSRLAVGSTMTRESALLLALMSSENRAANALARHYPGGMLAFIAAMNIKAQALGMRATRFDDPTGLTSTNQSTAHDLAKMVAAAYRYPLIREFSTTSDANVDVNGRQLAYHNTNPLVKSPSWDVGLSKTGYIHEAGKCLVMLARVAEKSVVIVLLDSAGKLTRVGDANRIKRWMERLYVTRKTALHTAQSPRAAGRA